MCIRHKTEHYLTVKLPFQGGTADLVLSVCFFLVSVSILYSPSVYLDNI